MRRRKSRQDERTKARLLDLETFILRGGPSKTFSTSGKVSADLDVNHYYLRYEATPATLRTLKLRDLEL